jgi:hypothetical protein
MDFHRQARPSVGLTCIYQSGLTLAPILYAFAQKLDALRAISFHLTRDKVSIGNRFGAGQTGVASHLVSILSRFTRSHSSKAGSFRPQSLILHQSINVV